MRLHIQATEPCDREQLRTLLIDAADELAGEHNRLLEAKLPWDGHPMLLADSQGHPVLVSFEPENSQAALVNGLAATEQLTAALPWINQVYESLGQQQRPPKLVIVSPEPPPGSKAILSTCPNLSLFNYRILKINGDTGLWLEKTSDLSTSAAAKHRHDGTRPSSVQPVIQSTTDDSNTALPSLSDEETAYFQQL
jgi:hypothetical protein